MHVDDVSFFLTGHRGARGLFPENSIPGFLHTLEHPVNAIELDVIISKDNQVVVSHEPWLHPEFCLNENGERITESEALSYNLYQMPYQTMLQFDCGSALHPRFPMQKKISVHKPLLSEVLEHCLPNPRQVIWDIEIKSVPAEYGTFQPSPDVFCELVLKTLKPFLIPKQILVRSFDYAPLQYLHRNYPELPLCLIVEDNLGWDRHIETLGFIPQVYSPDFTLVSETLLKQAHRMSCKVVPWTVNETSDMLRLIALGVDGLISDYPDRFAHPVILSRLHRSYEL
jgi:glycerophosphoryl diester phosphodiesterase